ncbi:threonine synthase [Algiphilus sp.]|uniref:threonine synthase n=3 Tax=Algiphilus sp. TaxID=1872431 RepID=UPI003453A3AA
MPMAHRYTGLIDAYRDRLPLAEGARAISLGEGNTPLIQLDNLVHDIGFGGRLFVKYEGLNPTGSFKDRGMTVAVSQAVDEGARAVICASTGNTSAAAAAYAGRAGITALVVIPDGKIAAGKLAQAVMHGAVVVQIEGNFDDGMRLVKEVGATAPVTIVNSINPFRLQGQKTAAFEIVDALGRAPDFHYLPVGNAGNITAHWIGYSEASGQSTTACAYCENDCRVPHPAATDNRPVMVGYQASGSAPFMRGGPVRDPDTVATAIRIGDPQSWDAAHRVQAESGGWFGELSDDEILDVQSRLAMREGVFCEPASAASLAGALRDIAAGRVPDGSDVVCTLTGHGLKDPEIAMRGALDHIVKVPAERGAIADLLAKKMA